MRQVDQFSVDAIASLEGRRKVNSEAVDRLAESLRSVGLRTPITVRIVDGFEDYDGVLVDGQPILVTGAHRLAAAKKLGWEQIECFVFDGDDEIDAQLWEIAENLHRAELSAMERSEQVAEWVRLTEEKQKRPSEQEDISSQVATKLGRKASGVNAASRELGISKDKAHRAVKIATISDEAKQAATAAGLANNQSALERIAKADDQVAEVECIQRERAARKEPAVKRDGPPQRTPADEASYAALLDAWNAATPAAKHQFAREQIRRAA